MSAVKPEMKSAASLSTRDIRRMCCQTAGDTSDLRWEANAICAAAVRNSTSIEDLHAEGKISQAEMRKLMIEISSNLEHVLVIREGLRPSTPMLAVPGEKQALADAAAEGYKAILLDMGCWSSTDWDMESRTGNLWEGMSEESSVNDQQKKPLERNWRRDPDLSTVGGCLDALRDAECDVTLRACFVTGSRPLTITTKDRQTRQFSIGGAKWTLELLQEACRDILGLPEPDDEDTFPDEE